MKANRDRRRNEHTSGNVTYWETYNDPNHNDRHAECNGVEFFAFPYSPYMAAEGTRHALVSGHMEVENRKTRRVWGARVGNGLSSGQMDWTDHEVFDDRDTAFEWAASKMQEV